MKSVTDLFLSVVIVILCEAMVLGWAGCDDPAKRIPVSDKSTPSSPPSLPVQSKQNRFIVESFGYFEAGYADNKREILIIRDSVTGKEYIGITGCGVTEMSKRGKTMAEE
jgi:hypothetical protein